MPPHTGRHLLLVLRYTVTENFVIADRVLFLPYAITGVTFNGVDNSVLDFLNDTRMDG